MKYRSHIFVTLLVLALSSSCVFSQTRTRLIIEQKEQVLKKRKLNRIGAIKEFYLDSMSTLNALNGLVSALHDNGFAEASIDGQVWKNDTATIILNVGKQYRFNSIDHGNVPDEILRKVGYKDRQFEGADLSGRRLNGLKKRILRFYENHGHPFAQVELDSLSLNGGQLGARLKLQKNQRFTIDSIIVKGDARIKSKYLQNYLGIRQNSLYNESKIRPISTRLKEIAFVNEVKQPEVLFNKGEADIYLYLDKKRASQFDGILGVLPSNENPGQVIVTGELSIKLLSAFKRGELISLRWQSLQPRTQNLNVQLNYPFLFNTAFGVDGMFELYKRDTLFLNLRGVAGVQYHLVGNDYIKVFADIRSTNVLAQTTLSSGATLNPDNVDSRTQLYGFGYRMQRLDFRLNPRKGFDIYAEASAGTKKIIPDASISERRYEGLNLNSFQLNSILQASYFVPIPNRSTLLVRFNGGYMFNENLFEAEAFRIGGLKTLRGFDEESIFATMFGIATLEYRFLINQNSYIFAFFDGAYYENQATNKNISDLPFGFGLGISFFTKIGIFSLNYALGRQFENPIDFRAGKIHFGVVSYF